MLAVPGLAKGCVRLEWMSNEKKSHLIEAHQSALSSLCLSPCGQRLATASEKGTLIRIFDTKTGQCLSELRRGSHAIRRPISDCLISFISGTQQATITSLCFSPNLDFFACSSDQGTIHVWSLKSGDNSSSSAEHKEANNQRSSLSFMSSILPKYFSSEWSFAQLKIKEQRSIVAFGHSPNTLIVLTSSGRYIKAIFDPTKVGADIITDNSAMFTRQASA